MEETFPDSDGRGAADGDTAGGLGGYLRDRRERLGLSIGALAQKAGVSRSALSRWEAGVRRRPHSYELEAAMADGLGMDAGERMRVHAAMGDARSVRRLWAEMWARTGVAGGKAPPLILPGDLLRDLRRRRGWTQGELAARLSAPQSAVARWESSDDWPDESRIIAACAELGASPSETELLTGWAAARAAGWQLADLASRCGPS